ncbi:MAG: peptidase M19 [Chloroflexi bacterium]|nr:peptidase M19 [Chloroflexota bacterium]
MKSPPLLVDAHEDLAWNILTFGRDYTRPAAETRRLEAGSAAATDMGETLLGWPEYQAGRVALVFATLFAAPERRRLHAWENQVYTDTAGANRLYRAQVDAYHRLADRHPDAFRLVLDAAGLDDTLAAWQAPATQPPVGLVILMEGADGVRLPDELGEWWELGVRIIGPAWAGNRYCGGTREPGPLTDAGRALLEAMSDLKFILDLSHMDELSARQALDSYHGPLIASHANAAALIPEYSGNRQLGDNLLRAILERDGIIGVVPYCRFLDYRWKTGDSRASITLETVASHIDHICQMAGDARHVGLGSDFDGGFGLASVPAEVDSIADLQKLVPILAGKGYTPDEITAIMGGNWIRRLKENLPSK